MIDASLTMQEAVYARLSAALAPVKVYDDVPQNEPFPYIAIGDDTQADWSTKDAPGQEHTLTIHAWSRAAGRKEVKTLLGKIAAALSDRPLQLAGHWNPLLYAEFQDTFLDIDGKTYHGVIRFRALTHQT